MGVSVAYAVVVLLAVVLLAQGYQCHRGRWGGYPRPYLRHNLITPAEAAHIRDTVRPALALSELLADGAKTDAAVRVSETAWLPKDDPVAASILARLRVPTELCEELQVVRYVPGGFYIPHYDSCCDGSQACANFKEHAGQRTRTIIIGLNEGYTGGRTVFPNLGKRYKVPFCGALEFYPSCDPAALHGGQEVRSGEKWIVNVWVRERPFS
jgi:prolyl 4-hydroxylase